MRGMGGRCCKLCVSTHGLDSVTSTAADKLDCFQAGRREAAAYARKHMLSQQTLEMLGDMRWQFASMLADSKFIVAPGTHRGAGSKDRLWVDDPKQPWNKQAPQPSLVRPWHYMGAWLCTVSFL